VFTVATGSAWRITVLLVCVIAGSLTTATAANADRLGVLYDEEREAPGTLETVGRDLAAGERVTALSRGAVVWLENGRVLRLAPNSSMLLESLERGDVDVTVLSGRVGTADDHGRALFGGAGSRFTLGPTNLDGAQAERILLQLELERPRTARDVDARRATGSVEFEVRDHR